MRNKIFLILLTITIIASMIVITPMTANAAETTERYIYSAETLLDGRIGVLFIYGGNSSDGIVTGGTLYYGIYDPSTNEWIQEAVRPGGSSVAAKDASMTIDSGGNPHIAYIFTNTDNYDDVGYTFKSGGTWSSAEVFNSFNLDKKNEPTDDGTLSSPDIALSTDDDVHLTWYDTKGGSRGGWSYEGYEFSDIVYCSNESGSFTSHVVCYGDGYHESGNGQYNIPQNPSKIVIANDTPYIGFHHEGRSRFSYGTWDTTHRYKIFNNNGTEIYNISYISPELYKIASDGTNIYSLYKNGSSLFLATNDSAGTGVSFSGKAADLYIDDNGDLFYAAINSSNLLLFQNGTSSTDNVLTTGINSSHTRMATAVSGSTQYIFYTGADTDKSLFIVSISTSGGEISEYQVPNKVSVGISGITVDDKIYDGQPVTIGGILSVTGADLDEEDLLYTYISTDGGGYNSTTPPSNAGTYELVISVPEENPTYTGSSSISFNIEQKELSVTGTAAIDRSYEAGNTSIDLNTYSSVLSGVISTDEENVLLDKSEAQASISDADAADGKAVTVTGFALTGSAAPNYSLVQPSDVTVNIHSIVLTAPSVALNSDSANGGLSFTVSDSVNSTGIDSYTVEVYQGTNLVKTITDVEKDVLQNIPLEDTIIVAELSYTAKTKAIADSSGNYSDSPLGIASDSTPASYAPLVFTDSSEYDIPTSNVGSAITPIDVSSGVIGGKLPYSFSAVGLPSWASISDSGTISGTPDAVASGGTATITVTDEQNSNQNITIAYGAVEKGLSLEFQGVLPPAEKTYGDNPIILELTYDGQTSNVSYSVTEGPGTIDGNTLTFTGAGNLVITATGTSTNYTDKTQDYTISVNRKSVTITPTPVTQTKVYGDADPVLDYDHSALVDSDSLSGSLLDRDAGENAGSYAISIAPDAEINNPDYQFSLAAGSYSFVITQKPINIANATIASKPYDGTLDILASSVMSVSLNGDIDSMILGTDYEVLSAQYTDDEFVKSGKPTIITIGLKDTAKANNYKFNSGDNIYSGATADITTATQVITASDQTLSVNNTLDLSTISSSNAPGAILAFSIEGGTSDYAHLSESNLTGRTPGAITINIDSEAVNIGGTGEHEYSAAATKQISVTVSAKENGNDTISFSDSTITYGESYTPNPTTTLADGVWSYSYNGVALDGTPYSGSTPPVKSGSYDVTAQYENETHIGINTANLTIEPKSITLSGIKADDREYDGTTSINISGGTLAGIINGDTVTANIPATGVANNANAGNNKTVSISEITLSGSDKDNYVLTQPSNIKVNILPKEITFTVDAISGQDYTGSQLTPEPIVKDGSTTLVENTDYTISYGSNIDAGIDEGSIIITGIGNYAGSSGTALFTINKVNYTGSAVIGTKQVVANTVSLGVIFDLSDLSFPSGFVNISYGTVSLANNSDGLITDYFPVSDNTLTFDAAAMDAGKSATFNVTVSSANYNDYQIAITVNTVAKTPVTITGVTVEDKTYDANPIVVGGTPIADNEYTGSYEYLYEGTGSTVYSGEMPPINAGTYNLIVRIPLSDTTYTGQQIISFNINKTELIVKPADLSIYTNNSIPALSIEHIGLKGSDTEEVAVLSSGNLNMEVKDTDEVSALSNTAVAGEYTIKFIGSPVFNDVLNYNITVNDGVLKISEKSSSGRRSSSTTPSVSETTAQHENTVITTEQTSTSTINKTEISANTSNNSATANVSATVIEALLDRANQTEGIEEKDIIEITVKPQNNIDSLNVNILQNDLAKIAEETDASLSITSPLISIDFDNKALETINKTEAGGNVVLSASKVDNEILSENHRTIVEDRPVYDLAVMNGNTRVSDFNGGHATVTIPYALNSAENPNAVVIYHLTNAGTLQAIRGHYDEKLKAVVFKTTHFSKFIIGHNPVNFDDVSGEVWYKKAVDFIAARNITSGTGNNKFNPDSKLTRGQFVVMLINAYQIPTLNGAELDQIQNFTDAGNNYYTEYLLTAKGLGIVNGIGNNLFAPEKEISRQEMIVMLHNALKVIDEVPSEHINKPITSFNDEDQVASWANEAMSALYKAGIVTGNNNYLNPRTSTTRAEIAQVLYNLLSK